MFAIFVPNFLSSSNLRLRKCHSFLTLLLPAEKGVIRFKHLPHFTPKPLDDVVDSLWSAMAS